MMAHPANWNNEIRNPVHIDSIQAAIDALEEAFCYRDTEDWEYWADVSNNLETLKRKASEGASP